MLPLSTDWHDDEDDAPPPPPPPHPHPAHTHTQQHEVGNQPSLLSSDVSVYAGDLQHSDSDDEPPIAPASYVAAIQQRVSQSYSIPPTIKQNDASSSSLVEVPMTLPSSVAQPSLLPTDEDDNDNDGEDDSDVESSTNVHSRLQPSSFSPSTNEDAIHDALAPLRELRNQQEQRQRQQPSASTRDTTVGKLSFTAPSLTSPLSQSSPDSFSLCPPSGSVTSSSFSSSSHSSVSSAGVGVDVSSLSNQISLHVELQSFAKARKKSLIMTGASDQSLIPQSVAPASESRPPVRRSNNIRSMSLSMSHGATIGWLANTSPAYTALKNAKRFTTTPVKERHVENILDLFDDGLSLSNSVTSLKPLGPLPAAILQQPNGQVLNNNTSILAPTLLLQSIPESSLPFTATPLSMNFEFGDEEPNPSSKGSKMAPNTPSSIPLPPPSLVDIDEAENETPPPPPPLPTAPNLGHHSSIANSISTDDAPASSPIVASTSTSAADKIPESDDLTSIFVPPSSNHISAVFPWRKIVRSDTRSTVCLLRPIADATDTKLDAQASVLGFLTEALKVRRTDFKLLLIDQLRAENEALKQLLSEVNTSVKPDRRSFGANVVASDAASHDLLRRSFVKVCSHARWNTLLHQQVTAGHLALEDGKRKLRMRWTRTEVASDEKKQLVPLFQSSPDTQQSASTHADFNGSPNAPLTNAGSPQQVAPSDGTFTRPVVSLAEISSKARSIGLGLGGTASNEWSSARNLNASFGSPTLSASPAPSSFAVATPSQDIPFSASSPSLHSTLSTNAQLQRFAITKINMIRKNTPRVLEMDLTTKTMTICKSKSGSKSYEDYEFSNRDIVITAGSIVSAELHPKNELQLDISFIIKSSTQSSSSSSQSFLSMTSSGGQQSSSKSKEKGQIVKNWKILFNNSGEREKFYRLLQVTLLTPERDIDARRGSAHSNLAAPSSDQTKRQLQVGLVGEEMIGGFTSTLYASHSQHQGPERMLTYTPHAPALTPAILSRVRMLPLLPLASSLHTVWCLTRKHEGWKYGLKLSDTNDNRKTHPFLVPFHALPAQRRDYHIKLVTGTLATVLALGFVIHRPFNGEETMFDSKTKTMTATLSHADASSISSSSVGVLSSSLSLHSSLLASNPFTNATSAIPSSFSSPALSFAYSPSTPSAAATSVAPDLLSLIDVFAESSHDLWSQEKLSLGWKWDVLYSAEAKTHPCLIPYAQLDVKRQEKEKNQAFRILATLTEWGYEISRPIDSTPSVGASGLAAQTSQPFSGSLKKHIHSLPSVAAQARSTKISSALFSDPHSQI